MKEADCTMLRKSAGSNALGTAGSVRTIGLPIRMLELENKKLFKSENGSLGCSDLKSVT